MESDQRNHRTILGIRFFLGTAREAVDRMQAGGLLVVPAAPALKDLAVNAPYREALLQADLTITDSAFMVMVWNRMQRDSIPRLSGLEYLRELLKQEDVREPGNCMWVMAGKVSAQRNLDWLREQGIVVPETCVYLAPMYGEGEVSDTALLEAVERARPKHVIVTLGGGTQERLGLYLKRNLSYLPAIHCIGAAIAFLSGDQVRIPAWVDRSYMGWLYRSISEPKRYVPRYWDARKLLSLMLRWRDRLPVPPA
ncbi:MAG: WecB/TagA/CpsF family glycosyltransferase [Acidobacteria bacterium]|nr:WecB/TagA/CpsF family glycosyltransferase [Acidobacteriota bacterium]